MAFPPPGYPPRGGVVVHQARVLPRLALVAVIVLVSTAMTVAIVWFAVLSDGDDVEVGRRGPGPSVVPEGPGGGEATGVALPTGWPDDLRPPADATVVSSVANGAGTPGEHLVLVYEVPRDAGAAAEELRGTLATAGLRLVHDVADADGGSLQAIGAGRDASISVGPVAARPGVTTVSWFLRRGPR